MKRLHSFIFFIFLFTVLLFAVTCKKEYSYEGGDIAQYNFVGSPNACTNVLVNGAYYKGVAVDSSNNIALLVDVTKKGKYDIKTDGVNGISFSASGKFSDTCSRCELLLTGNGTPDSAGVFTFHIPGTTGCYFSVTVNGVANAVYQLSGAPNNCANPVEQGTYIEGVQMVSANFVTINVDVLSKGPYGITTDQVNGIYFSASGNFTSTGTQQLILAANLTPVAPELSEFRINAFDTAASQCTFYVPVANANPVATYVLQSSVQGSTAYCSPGSVQGTYTANKQLINNNTLTVNAYVTVPGNFTISTTEQNGMKFYFTGTFTQTGAQDVVLQGNGTPATSGTFTFFPQIVGPAPIGGSTCGLDVTVQ